MNERPDLAASGAPITLTQDAYDRLRADIMSGALAPGLKLKVADLCRRYEVGASPVREALSRLSSESLVDKTENRGFRVSSISDDQYLEIYDLRCLLEAEALRRTIQSAGRDWEDRLTISFFRLDRSSRGTPGWEDLHRAFHLDLVSAAGSRLMLDQITELYDQAVRYRNISRKTPGEQRDPRAEHKAIFDAAIARQKDEAVNALLCHYKRTLHHLSKRESAANS